MPAATASVSEVSRADISKEDAGRGRDKAGRSQAQCSPMPLPALGTQKIIQGNGTNLGTIISLQCPAKHKLVGDELKCVMGINSTHWVGETYCKPLSPFEDYGFRVAVLASIVSLGVIFIMSVAFITCCLLDCMKEDDRKKQEREPDLWQCEEQVQHRGASGSHYSHKGRNNNNNTQEKILSTAHNPAVCDGLCGCRCKEDFARGPAYTNGSSSSFTALPGQEYAQPLLPRHPEPARSSGPLSNPGHPPFPCQTTSQPSVMGPDLLRYGEQRRPSREGPSTADQSSTRNPAREFSIRIISV